MALNKSKDNAVLTAHCLVYAGCFLFWGWKFALITFLLHWATDYWTSRLTSRLWFITLEMRDQVHYHCFNWACVDSDKRHWFFVAIGFDQLIHFTMLALTYRWLA